MISFCLPFLMIVLNSPEVLGMLELYDNMDLPIYGSAILYLLSIVTPPREYVELAAEAFINTIQSTSVSSLN